MIHSNFTIPTMTFNTPLKSNSNKQTTNSMLLLSMKKFWALMLFTFMKVVKPSKSSSFLKIITIMLRMNMMLKMKIMVMMTPITMTKIGMTKIRMKMKK